MSNSDGFLTVREEQMAELEVMKDLHAYCVKHGLRYVLGYGTLLGAVRHKGFIPWDNDMDIYMPREDITKLVELSKKEPISPIVQLFDHTADDNYHYAIVRACNTKTVVEPSYLREPIRGMGVWVDLFPLDGIIKPKIWIQNPLRMLTLRLLNATLYLPDSESKAKAAVRKFILKCLPNRNHKYERRVSSICAWSKYDKAKSVCVLCEDDTTPDSALDRVDIENPELVPFEDTEFFIPRNADKYLRLQYGDYMQLPPEEDRMTHSLCSRYR